MDDHSTTVVYGTCAHIALLYLYMSVYDLYTCATITLLPYFVNGMMELGSDGLDGSSRVLQAMDDH